MKPAGRGQKSGSDLSKALWKSLWNSACKEN